MSRTTLRVLAAAATATAAVLVTGCANITGLDGQSSYSCKAPEGVKCDSVSGNYHNAIQHNLPAQRRSLMSHDSGGGAQPPAAPLIRRDAGALLPTAARTGTNADPVPYHPAPLRAAPRVMRLWIKPWEDADRDLVGESVVYVQVDNGRWLVDHVQRQAREPFAPVRPGKLPAASNGKASPTATAEDATPVTQALRALQQRSAAQADN